MRADDERESACARCGTPFACGMLSEAPCWCAQLPPLEPVPGRGCLCRGCLEDELRCRAQST